MTEIKISELSIGDWVRVDDFDKVLIKRVSAIDGMRNQIGIIKNNRGGIYWYCDDEIEPILLTPEILEKNGFEEGLKNGEAYKIKVSFNQHLWLFKVGDGCWMFRLVLGLFEDFDIAKVEIKYVHQLQHALRLAGVEKEIEV